MATNKVCDICGNTAAQPVYVLRVALEVEKAVAGRVSTGRLEQIEACEGCWGAAFVRLGDSVRATLLRDIPVHRQIATVEDELAELGRQLAKATARRDAMVGNENPVMIDAYTEAAAEVDRLAALESALETKRMELIASAA
jgi:hypothetical protein